MFMQRVHGVELQHISISNQNTATLDRHLPNLESAGSELTSVISLEAAAALICRLGCFTELEQSNARAKVPTDLESKK